MKKKVLMIISSADFRDEEYREPKAILEKNGFRVVTACSSLSPARGMLGMVVRPDITLEQVEVSDYRAILFIGGSGSKEYWDNKTAHLIARDAVSQDLLLGAICLAPVTLARAGLLSDKRVTVFPSSGEELINRNAFYTRARVETDGKIVTADGPASSSAFGKQILKLLQE